jgi:hypothetical protein
MYKQQLQYVVNNKVKQYIPEQAWDSTVAIVIAHNHNVYQFGSGILFRIADESFVVTACHVIKDAAHKYNGTLGITSANESFVAVPGEWICSSEGQYGTDKDPFDVAIYNLQQHAVQKLNGKRLLYLNDIDFGLQSGTGVYTLFGYPGIWSKPSTSSSEELQLKPFQYTTIAFNGDTRSFKEYQERFHLLLEAQLKYSSTEKGTKATFRDLEGKYAPFPERLGGISGCSVWRIGDLDVPIDDWGQKQPKIVAVQTSVYHTDQVIKATRWIAVSTLIHGAFPKLRPAMDLWWPQNEI